MFPSAGHFAGTHCPFVSWGRCERPYCVYKHSASLSVCSVRGPGATGHDHVPEPSPFRNQEASSPCLLELERLNKQIEVVRSEVEQEQKRLSRYQSELGESNGSASEEYFKFRPAPSKDHNRNQMKNKKTTTTCKYVVDRSRPKTDLEYDPCSNFSADLRSGSSIDKNRSTHKADMERDEGDKDPGKGVCADSVQTPFCSLEDSDEGTLVIDIPPFEDSRRQNRALKQRTAASHAVAALRGIVPGEKGLSKKGANLTKLSGAKKKTTDLPLLDKIRPTNKDESNVTKLHSTNSNVDVNIPHQENDVGTPKPSSVPSEDGSSLGIGPGKNEEKRVATDQPESSWKVLHTDASPVDLAAQVSNGSKRNPAVTGEEAKQWASKPPVNVVGPPGNAATHEKSYGADVSETSQLCHSDKPVSADVLSLGGCEERGQTIEHVLDDISICLDNLRSESEGVACLQEVEDLLNGVPACSKMDGDLFSPPAKISEERMTANRTEFSGQQNLYSVCAYKQESLAKMHSLQESMVVQDCFPNMSTLSAITKEPGPSNSAFAEVCWSPARHVLPQPVILSMPVCVPGPDAACVPSPRSEPLGSMAAWTGVTQTQDQVPQNPSVAVASGVPYEMSSALQISSPAVMDTSNNSAIQNDSSSSEELNYSDFDLSETDPMEECYNIFMEANKADGVPVQDHALPEISKTPEAEVSLQLPPAQKKRVAHVARAEVSKSKAQVIVPLREGGPLLSLPSQAPQCQKRAVALASALKGCQSLIAASVPRRVVTPAVIHPSPAPNCCVSILPVGTSLRLGSDLHLIIPEGNGAVPITLIPAVLPVTRPFQQAAPSPQPVQAANYTPAKAIPTKRKAKGRAEVGVRVPHDVRQRYVNLFVEEFLKTSATVQDAFEKALAEEKTVFDRSINKLKYLSIAVNALKRLKNQNASPATLSSERNAQPSRGNVVLNTAALLGDGDAALYAQLKEHVLTEALLRENNYPRKHPDQTGSAVLYGEAKKCTGDAFRRICCRCGTTFSVGHTGKHTRKEECNYHSGKVLENRVPGGVETRYSCCESAVGTPGCQVFKLHVHDAVSLQGFVRSLPSTCDGCPGVYAIDTETCYTTQGLELVRVTVVNSSLQVIYDTFVKPDNEVIDYNTRFSGVGEDEVTSSSSTLRDVQAVLLTFISEGTIVVGHGLENDLCALKFLHSTVVDTSVVFPHRLGPPHKRDLNSLTAETLRRIIQESAEGRDSREDAVACMELILWKVKEDSKVKRW